MARQWNAQEILALASGYQPACVLTAAAQLELFEVLAGPPFSAGQAAARLQAHERAVTILLDALTALELLDKHADRYQVPASVAACLTRGGRDSVLAMAQHQANCLRRWVQLSRVIKTGQPAERTPSLRGEQADQAAFIEAMHNVCAPIADGLVRSIQPLEFSHVLDVGGGSGTWTIALLRARPGTRATIFDLPGVIPLARRRVAEAGLADRVRLVPGDFEVDRLPSGADLAWVSAIVHQNSRDQNRALFAAVRDALRPGGQILIRDILMDESRTRPAAGALFAINMLVGTTAGNSYTFAELRDDLRRAGFTSATLVRRDEWMNSLIRARLA